MMKKYLDDKKIKTWKINGYFYPWTLAMSTSAAMQRLRKNSDAINIFSMFISQYSSKDKKKDICITYSEAKPFMSPGTFAKGKLWLTAFGFLHCLRFGQLERKPSLYNFSGKWEALSRQPEKLDRIEHLLKRHEKVLRIPASKIQDRNPLPGRVRKKMILRQIEKKILSQ